jgi:hypothetical protein
VLLLVLVNNFEGSTYFYRDQALAGKTPLETGSSTREKLADCSNYGVRAGGAITKK